MATKPRPCLCTLHSAHQANAHTHTHTHTRARARAPVQAAGRAGAAARVTFSLFDKTRPDIPEGRVRLGVLFERATWHLVWRVAAAALSSEPPPGDERRAAAAAASFSC
jgi:hypothetical protein